MFGASPARRLFGAALRDAESASAKVRREAVVDLARLGEERREETLAALDRTLQDAAPEVRSASALALADLHASELLGSLLAAVDDSDAHVRESTILALGEIGDARASESVRLSLSAREPAIRFQALIAFVRVAKQEALAAIGDALSDSDDRVRHIALRLAEEHREAGHLLSDQVLRGATNCLDDPSGRVRVAAAILLAPTGDARVHSLLIEVTDRTVITPEAEDEACALLWTGKLGLSGARAGLTRRAYGAGRFRRETFAWQAMVALARLGDRRSKDRILAGLTAWSRDRRTLAAAAAGEALLAEAVPFLRSMAGDPRRADGHAVEQALSALEPGLLAGEADRPLTPSAESADGYPWHAQ